MAIKPLKFRPPGAPAGTWPATHWSVCVFYDPYERINFWSHLLPGVAFVVLALAAKAMYADGTQALPIFCVAAATTHLLSALTHVFPDDHLLEKCDHLGIVALILGTPFTAALALDPHGNRTLMIMCAISLVAAAFLKPLLRTLGFVGIGAVMFLTHPQLVNANLCVQVALYIVGAISFVRNGGHQRLVWLTDHHILHYVVTVACCLHVHNLVQLTAAANALQFWPTKQG